MELQLKNIGMIKEANVEIDGLTVIAGENDTGKSTLGKALYILLNVSKVNPTFLIEKLFKKDDNFLENAKLKNLFTIQDVIFIETPLVWNLQDYFQTSVNIESHLKMLGEDIDISYPYLMKDLYFKLVTQKNKLITANDHINKKYARDTLADLMNGEFIQDKRTGLHHFHRDDEIYNLVNIASGIKYFGLIQVLLDNSRLYKDTVLILDEPEVHLHPKWQLEMANIIVELVKNGVKIVVNSHSPYMIEALKRYSEVKEIEDKTNFYLAEDGAIHKIENSNSLTLEKIFEKLSEPFDIFDEMDSQRLQNG